MNQSIKHILLAAAGLTLVIGLAGCNSQPKTLTQDEFTANKQRQQAAQPRR